MDRRSGRLLNQPLQIRIPIGDEPVDDPLQFFAAEILEPAGEIKSPTGGAEPPLIALPC